MAAIIFITCTVMGDVIDSLSVFRGSLDGQPEKRLTAELILSGLLAATSL
ncbi:hypothetical protein [Escherichia coli]